MFIFIEIFSRKIHLFVVEKKMVSLLSHFILFKILLIFTSTKHRQPLLLSAVFSVFPFLLLLLFLMLYRKKFYRLHLKMNCRDVSQPNCNYRTLNHLDICSISLKMNRVIFAWKILFYVQSLICSNVLLLILVRKQIINT